MKLGRVVGAIYIFLVFALAIFANVNFKEIFALPDNFMASYSDVENVNDRSLFGSFIRANMEKDNTKVDGNAETEGVIVFKLFNIIPIRKVSVQILPEEEVYVGGVPIGLSIQSSGALVVSDTLVDTQGGTIKTQKNSYFKAGDIITKIGGHEIESLDDIDDILKKQESDKIEVEYLRKNKKEIDSIKLLKDDSGKYKLGLWVRDDISGIGTLTFVDKKSHAFGALGHPITNNEGGNIVPITSGKVYSCSLLGINKGQKNNPGELKCLFMQSDERGSIESNNRFGIFGRIDNTKGIVDENLTAPLGGRLGVNPGKATIVSSVSGIREEYEIEIIKASFQSKSSDKSIVFRVKDKRLLELTGGIVQGMSGSPIVQNGKIIGAVTHVFLNDPTKGYGVYTDWMKP